MENLTVKLHPFFAHFPIVLIIAYCLLLIAKKELKPVKSDYYWIFSIVASIIFALLSGNMAEEYYEQIGIPGNVADAVELHEAAVNYLILNTIIIFLLIFYFAKQKESNLFHKLVVKVLAVINIGFVLAVGYYGAELVQVYGLGTNLFKI